MNVCNSGRCCPAARGHVVQQTFDCPRRKRRCLAAARPGGRPRIIRRVNAGLAEAVPPGVSMLDTERLVAGVGMHAGKPRRCGIARAAPVVRRAARARGRADGARARRARPLAQGRRLRSRQHPVEGRHRRRRPARHQGRSRLARGRSLCRSAALSPRPEERGIMLAVCSKNNLEDAQAPFREKAGMVLRLDDFAAFQANWDDKAENLRRIAARSASALGQPRVHRRQPVRAGVDPEPAARSGRARARDVGRDLRPRPGSRPILPRDHLVARRTGSRRGLSPRGRSAPARRETGRQPRGLPRRLHMRGRASRCRTRTSSASPSSPTRPTSST